MKNILIKVSGDLNCNWKFLDFARSKSGKNKVVIICGAGTQINEGLEKNNFEIKFCNHGRIIKSLAEEKIVVGTLEKEKEKLEKNLSNDDIFVKIPVIDINGIKCHVNADNLVKTYYLGFDEIYVFTLKKRIKDKTEIFKKYLKVKIIGV